MGRQVTPVSYFSTWDSSALPTDTAQLCCLENTATRIVEVQVEIIRIAHFGALFPQYLHR